MDVDAPSRGEHGQHDPQADKWFCGYWMTLEEWEDVHDYAPPLAKGAAAAEDQGRTGGNEQQEDDDDAG